MTINWSDPDKAAKETLTPEQLKEFYKIETDAPCCPQCGNLMQQTGRCHTCPECGYNEGCG